MKHLSQRNRSSTIEILEARIAPATLVTFNPATGSLDVDGDFVDDGSQTPQAGAQESLVFSTNATTLFITDTQHGVTINSSGLTQVNSRQVSISLSSLTGNFAVNSGIGADTLLFNSLLTLGLNKSFNVDTAGTISFTGISDVTATGTGSIILTSTNGNISMAPGATMSVVDGALGMSANTGAAGTGNFIGISFDGNSITSSGSGLISVFGQASGTAGGTAGVTFVNGAGILATGTGGITITGNGSTSGTGSNNFGVNLQGGSGIFGGGSGTVNINGTGGAGTGSNHHGVNLANASTTILTSGGSVQISGLGGGTGASTASSGVHVSNGAQISAGGAGAVTVQGTGGVGRGSGNFGVNVDQSAFIDSAGGPVDVIGTGGGGGTSGADHGVVILNGGTISAGGASSGVTVDGTGGPGSGSSTGVFIGGSDAKITSGGGVVFVFGKGGPGSSSTGINLTNPGASITTAINGGSIFLVADRMNLAGPVATQPGGSVTVNPMAPGTLVDLGSGGVSGVNTLELSDAELDFISTGTISISGPNNGSLTVSSSLTITSALSLGGGTEQDLNLNASITTAGRRVDFLSKVVVGGLATVDTTNGGASPAGAEISFGDTLFLNPGQFTHNAGAATSIIVSTISGDGSFRKEGTGSLIFFGNHTYTGSTTVAAGFLELSNNSSNNPIAASGLITLFPGTELSVAGLGNGPLAAIFLLGSSQTLVSNNGTVQGSLGGSGAIVPGGSGSTATLTVNGDFKPTGTVAFDVEAPYANAGTDFDRIFVFGALDLSGATLQFLGGTTPPSGPTQMTLISHVPAGATVAGFNPQQGASVTFGQATFNISYSGGDGNDVVLVNSPPPGIGDTTVDLVNGKLIITDGDTGNSNDAISITRPAGGNIRISDPGHLLVAGSGVTQIDPNTVELLFNAVTNGIEVNTLGGTDSLNLDLSNEGVFPAGGIFFDGGIGADSLFIVGGSQGAVNYNYLDANSGSIAMDAIGTAGYAGLETISNTGLATDLFLNLPTGENIALLSNVTVSGRVLSRLSGTTFAETIFLTPTTFLTINPGSPSDELTFGALKDLSASVVAGSSFGRFGLITIPAGVRLGLDSIPVISLSASSVAFAAGSEVIAISGSVTTRQGEIAGILNGGLRLHKDGEGVLTLKGRSGYTGGTIVDGGTINFNSDQNFGSSGTTLEVSNSTLHATATIAVPRPVVLSGGAIFEADPGKTLTLSGLISGGGSLQIGPSGKVRVTGLNNTNTGPVELDSDDSQVVNGVKISVPGATGNVIITPGATPGSIASIDLTGTDVPLSLSISAPKGQTVTVEKIISNDLTVIKAITLGVGVKLGDGLVDAIADVVIMGKVGAMKVADVNPNTIIQLGKGLAYLDTYLNKPNLTMGNVGDGVVIDVAGDGVTTSGTGGGGLGKVIINSWLGVGTIKTTQSIKSLLIRNGDFDGTVQVDPDNLGAATVAGIGSVSVPNGQWIGAGMQVEGVVAKFLTKGLAFGSTISAGAFGPVVIKGDYAGTIVATFDASIATTVKNKTTINATGNIASVAIAGDFSGLINADGKVGNVTLTGTASFQGTLRGGSIGNITAGSFTGTPGLGGVRDTITAAGSIGKITAKQGGLTDYVIAAGTNLGSDALYGGIADVFGSFTTSGTGVSTAVSIGAVTIKGSVTGTTIAAGINPGGDGVYGTGDDARVPLALGTRGLAKLGALKFETALATVAFATAAGGTINNAFEAQSLTSVSFGKVKTPATHLASFLVPSYLDSGASTTIVRVL